MIVKYTTMEDIDDDEIHPSKMLLIMKYMATEDGDNKNNAWR